MIYFKPSKKIIANLDYRIQQSFELSFVIEGEIKIFHDKQKLKKFMVTKPPLQKKFRGILLTKKEDKCNHENAEKNKFH
jgi:hypothetical protein